MSAITRAVTGLARTLKRIAGESAVYARAPATEIDFTAVHHLETYEVYNDEGFPESLVSHDFLVTAADLVATLTPRPGDRITITIASVEATFEVMPIGNRPCYHTADPGGIMWVIHSKQVT